MFTSKATVPLLTRSIGIAVALALVSAMPVQAQIAASPPQPASKHQNIGVASGIAVGAVAGGPIGAILGATAGAWIGDRYHRQTVARQALAADLDRSESELTRLAQHLTEANESLMREQERIEQLNLALSHTDEFETVVSFRTNEDWVQSAAVSALRKLGALVAALPDATVRVAGYADPRGSDALNAALSHRRAESVAAILTAAGVAPERLIVEAYGKSAAQSDSADIDGYAFDRHVTVRIERTTGEAVARNE